VYQVSDTARVVVGKKKEDDAGPIKEDWFSGEGVPVGYSERRREAEKAKEERSETEKKSPEEKTILSVTQEPEHNFLTYQSETDNCVWKVVRVSYIRYKSWGRLGTLYLHIPNCFNLHRSLDTR
jgi:hypothetical protein